ncbi:MAG: iron-containing alcohol dehydrogenase, partial [Blautia sp.]|nr:iron-containing alcohol dehydrogenase [Blautia sp.]
GADPYDYSEEERAYILSEKLSEFFRKLGLKTTLTELGIDGRDFEVMAKRATRNGRVGHYLPLDAAEIVEILNLAR